MCSFECVVAFIPTMLTDLKKKKEFCQVNTKFFFTIEKSLSLRLCGILVHFIVLVINKREKNNRLVRKCLFVVAIIYVLTETCVWMLNYIKSNYKWVKDIIWFPLIHFRNVIILLENLCKVPQDTML